jgi:hypothetical protein
VQTAAGCVGAALREDAGLTVVVTVPGEELAHPATAAITGSANRAAFTDSEAIRHRRKARRRSSTSVSGALASSAE